MATLCIVLRTDGSSEQVQVDTTALEWERRLIAQPTTIVGMFEAIDTIVIGIDQDAIKILGQEMPTMSLHSLPPPLEDEELFGDVVLFRCDDNMAPIDLSLAEWHEFSANPGAPRYAKAMEEKVRRERAAQMEREEEEELAEDYSEMEEDGPQ